MKKYTVKDNLGNKKTIYANDLSHALTFVDSKVKDASHPKTFKFFINNRAVSENEYIKSFIEEAANEHQSSTTAKRVINEDKESAKISGKNTFMSESGRKFSIIYDSVKDEASLATTINALVNDEKAAIDAYDVAIKNLEGSIDDTTRQVLINIMKDERRHVENLYAVLNGQVTEKNLEDSIHDSYVEVPLVLNRFQIEAIQENWFDIKDTGKKENGFPVYRLTGDKEKIFRWLRTRYDKKFPLSAIHDSVKSPSAYVNTRLVKNMLPNDLMAEGLKNDYSFNDVLKNFDAISSKILDVVKDALDEAKRDIIDFKRNYINALIN